MKGALLAAAATGPALVLGMSAALLDALGSVYPPPDTIRSFVLMPPGWHSFVWTGPSGTEPGTALGCMGDDFAITYRLQSNQRYERYVPGRTDLSNMGTLNKCDSLLVLITDSGAQCVGMPIDP
jgi:hypothetical protein